MTFNAENLVQWSASPTPPRRNLPQWWGYYTTDAIATVEAADYFNLNSSLVIGRNTTWYIGDQLYCVCSDGVVILQIAALTPNVTTTAGNANIPAGSIVNSMIAANAAIDFSKLAALTSADILVGSAGNVATAVAVTGDVSLSNAGVMHVNSTQAAAVNLASLTTGITPSHVVKYAAKYTTVGGAAAEAIAIAGVLSTDLPFVQLVNHGANTVSVAFAVPTTNTLTVTFSADPGSATIINYQILRAAS